VSERPRVVLVGLGGTISAVPDDRGHAVAARSAAGILASVPGAEDFVEIRAADVRQVSSRAITPADMCSLAHKIRAEVENGCAGVVVTHGTDTMEETAYALALMVDVDVPIVLTGAMRLAHEPGADGPANLMAALRVAATPEAAALGPVVVMHDEIHAARWVTKLHTSKVAAFSSPGFGPVGQIAEGRVRLRPTGPSRDYMGLPDRLDQRVELVWVWAGADGLLVKAAAAAADGLVIAGTGGGHVPPVMAESLREVVERGLPTVLASRCVGGAVLEETYGGVGSETYLIEVGLRPVGLLSALKARLRLLTALALGLDASEAFPV
jgi:L-asparaginase